VDRRRYVLAYDTRSLDLGRLRVFGVTGILFRGSVRSAFGWRCVLTTFDVHVRVYLSVGKVCELICRRLMLVRLWLSCWSLYRYCLIAWWLLWRLLLLLLLPLLLQLEKLPLQLQLSLQENDSFQLGGFLGLMMRMMMRSVWVYDRRDGGTAYAYLGDLAFLATANNEALGSGSVRVQHTAALSC